MANRQVVFLFGEKTIGNDATMVRGGKGANLAEMAALGLPIPPGFTVSTTVGRALRETGRFPNRFEHQLNRGIESLERKTGKKFGDPKNPLLVSVRSGAAVSMPRMMDTVLNLGITTQIAQGLAEERSKDFAFDCYRRFLALYGEVVLGIPRQLFAVYGTPGSQKLADMYRNIIRTRTGSKVMSDPWEQLSRTIEAVFRSWDTSRARAYRTASKVPDWWGSAVNVQAMVFGNAGATSATGVAFSRNMTTGKPGLWGEFLPNAQGEDVVAGTHTPLPIEMMRSWNGSIYEELDTIVRRLDHHYGDAVDVEFTVEDGVLYILQCRIAKRTPAAGAMIAVHQVWAKRWSKADALGRFTEEAIEKITRPQFRKDGTASRTPIAHGLAASPGATTGIAAFSASRAVELARGGKSIVLLRPDTNPDDFEGMLASAAVLTAVGGTTSHAAVVARGLGIPAIVGVSDLQIFTDHATLGTSTIFEGATLSVDGDTGCIFIGEVPFEERAHGKEINIFLRWAREEGLLEPLPRIGFEQVSNRQDVNNILADFYLLDHMTHAARETALSKEVRAFARQFNQQIAEFFACYLVIAVGGELRYMWNNAADLNGKYTEEMRRLRDAFGVGAYDRREAQDDVFARLSKMPIANQIEFFELAVKVFRGLKWDRSMGGAKWADIAETALFYVTGRIGSPTFIDRCFDLQHNTGAIFDKHQMVWDSDDRRMRRLLDQKKLTRSAGELYTVLCHFLKEPEVLKLWNKGTALGLW